MPEALPEGIDLGVKVVVVDGDQRRVLLHKREDFRIWALPGGGVDEGETPEQAAVRETVEETGYQVEVVAFVGEYHHPQLKDWCYVYKGALLGGEPISQGPETLEVGWFPPDELPKRVSPSVHMIIRDSFSSPATSFVRVVKYPIWQVFTFRGLLWLRNLRNKLWVRG
jgi:8-oxo-dGTP pyrophosphatase MutT (NUDIX family)